MIQYRRKHKGSWKNASSNFATSIARFESSIAELLTVDKFKRQFSKTNPIRALTNPQISFSNYRILIN